MMTPRGPAPRLLYVSALRYIVNLELMRVQLNDMLLCKHAVCLVLDDFLLQVQSDKNTLLSI